VAAQTGALNQRDDLIAAALSPLGQRAVQGRVVD
jgi:hypothetical protein